MTLEQIIKVIAKGMFADDADYHHGQEWDDDACFTYIRKATAALSALKAAGLAVVPVEPTEEMIKTGERVGAGTVDMDVANVAEIYRAMVDEVGYIKSEIAYYEKQLERGQEYPMLVESYTETIERLKKQLSAMIGKAGGE